MAYLETIRAQAIERIIVLLYRGNHPVYACDFRTKAQYLADAADIGSVLHNMDSYWLSDRPSLAPVMLELLTGDIQKLRTYGITAD